MKKNIKFTNEELEILHNIVIKEKNGLKHAKHGTIFGKESFDNYFKDLNDIQSKIESFKKEEIKILIVTNTDKQASMRAEEFIEELSKKLSEKVADFELGKKGTAYVGGFNSFCPIGLTVKFDKFFYKSITIEVEGDKEIKEISIKFMGSQQIYDGTFFDKSFIDYTTFFHNKNIMNNGNIGKQVYELEQKLNSVLVKSKYYKKELPQLVKMLLD